MYTVTILKLAVFTLFPLVTTVPIPPFAPRPLCNFQLALANQACAYLPSSQVPPPPSSPFNTVRPTPPPPPERHLHIHSHSHKHGDEQGHDDHGSNETHVPEHGHGHDRGHNRHEQHKRDYGHGHHKHHRMSPVEQQCCKWLAQVDDECVCELLGRLPPFLARPIHEYTLRVAGSCNVTYSCGALFRI